MLAERADGDGVAATALHPSTWLIVPTLALLLGQGVAASPWQIPYTAGFSAIALLLPLWFARWWRWTLLLAISALAFTVGYVRHRQILAPIFADHHLRSVIETNERLYLEGQLAAEPERLINRSRWLVRAERVWHPTGAEEISGDLLVTVRLVRRDWRFGDRMRFWIRPTVPRDSGNPGGFDYAKYLAQREVYVVGFMENDAEVELIGRDPGPVRGVIEDIRRTIRRYIDQSFSADNGGLLKALVVGDMGGISKEVRAAFTDAGVNHVLSISGLHVAMLGLVVFAAIRYGLSFSSFLLLRWNLLKLATFLSFFAVVFYTALAGAMVPTVRSAIMIGVYQLAVLLDREEEVFASLTLAALLIALVWPGVIADISFQLSFLAVLFIAWGMRKIHQRLSLERREELPQERSWLKEKLRQISFHLAVPLLATLGTGPLIAHYFGHLSLAGFVTNPLIVPLVGFLVVPLGLMIGLLTLTLPELAWPLAWLGEKLLAWTIAIVELFARLPLANFAVPSPNMLEVIALYLFLVGLFIVRRRWQLMTVLSLGLLLVSVDLSFWWGERYRQTSLRVTHLNVGQGDAAVVELPGGKVLLIDAGGAAVGDFDTGESIVAPFLRARKILKVDHLLVTHARIDHYGGMRAIVNEFSPSEFWSGTAKGNTRRFEDLEEVLDKAKIPRLALSGGEPCRRFESVELCVLTSPEAGDEAPIVLRVGIGKVRLLFASDIDKRGEALLAQKPEETQSAVVKIPRHGSTTASSKEFIAAVQPKLAILSAGARSRAEAQRDEVVERYRESGTEVLRTYEDGAIILETDGHTLRYSGYKSGKKGELRF